jgi:glutathione S-transferase
LLLPQGLEQQLASDKAASALCDGDTPTMADCCLVPQIYNARRFECDLSLYPTLTGIVGRCEELPAFRDAAPERQPDAG